MLVLFLLLLLIAFASAFFSGSETGFVSWNPLKVAHAAAQGNINARMAMRLMNHRGQLLAAILTGNNVCNVLAALVFINLYERIDKAVPLNLSAVSSPESWFLTPVLLLFGEVLPKLLFRTYPYRLTMKTVPALAALYYATTPFFWVFGRVAKIFDGGAGESESLKAKVREEIVLVAVEGAKRGTLFDSADSIMKNTLGMKGKNIGSLAVPLGEWKKNRPVFRASQMLSELGAGSLSGADEVVVFDDGLGAPAGYVSLLDAAARGGGGLETFGALVKPLPRVKAGMEVLACVRRLPPDSPRYCAVVENDAVTAVLDKMSLYEAAFVEKK